MESISTLHQSKIRFIIEGGKAEQNLEETWNKVIEAFKLLNNKIDRLSEKLKLSV